MNIFLLDLDPTKAAQAHADKHVVKMLLEACQLLYTAHWVIYYPHILEYKAPSKLAIVQKNLAIPDSIHTAPPSLSRPNEPGFRPCHIHHPCAKWVRESLGNYLWAASLAKALAEEYKYRWAGKGEHECAKHAEWLFNNPPKELQGPQTAFVQAMEERFKDPDPVVAYRRYYVISKGQERGMWKYTKRDPPNFN